MRSEMRLIIWMSTRQANWTLQNSKNSISLNLTLEAAGEPIGMNDLLIAAHAHALGLTLVTDNLREFTRIRDLKVENWLA